MAATQTLALPSPHSDLITSLQFSPQSTHLATCSLDSQIRIVQRSPHSPSTYDHSPVLFKAHDGPVLSLAWSPSQLGLILASGGVDGTIKIWRQPNDSTSKLKQKNGGGNPHSAKGVSPQWICVSTITEPRGTVRSLGFSPSEFGLKLAGVSSDGRLRVWECLDPVKSEDWSMLEEIDLNNLPNSNSNSGTNSSGFSHSSNTSGGGNDAGAGGGAGASGTSQGSSSNNNQNQSGGGHSASSVDGNGRQQGIRGTTGRAGGGTVESDGGWSLSWCREHWWGERLAVSSGTNGIIRLFHLPSHAPWSNFLTLYPTRQTLSSSSSSSSSESLPHLAPTCSLNWAPPSGRSYQLLASGSKDSKVRVYKIFPPSLQQSTTTGGVGISSIGGEGEWTAQLDVELDESSKKPAGGGGGGSANGSILNGQGSGQGQGQGGSSTPNSNSTNQGQGAGAIGATKVEWNVTGTVLSTSGGEDGKVRLWKSTYTGQWRQITSLSTETPSQALTGGGGRNDGMNVDH